MHILKFDNRKSTKIKKNIRIHTAYRDKITDIGTIIILSNIPLDKSTSNYNNR